MIRNKLAMLGAIAAVASFAAPSIQPRMELPKQGKPGRKDRRKMERQNRKKGRK